MILMSSDIQSNNKRIAKNTMMLYIRMGISMLVGLYTSRVILQVLGVSDYGIYGVVGGIVAFMGFLNSSMSGATSRFLTYELGRGAEGKLKETFVSSFWVHLIIAAVILVLAETVGLWFLYNKLVIPEARMDAAFWVYQFSVASAVVGITQVPYNANVISHEDMDLYAYVEIANVLLKLVIVYLLIFIQTDKLILYAALYFAVSFGIAMYYRWYCIHHYEESRLILTWHKEIVNKMLKFCGWDLYGNGCVVAKQQGINFLVNMFFGVIFNASISIASVVDGTLLGFTRNITLALRPQIIKNYVQKDYITMQNLMVQSIKYIILLQACCTIPFVLEADYVLHLWLDTVPPYAVVFCQWMCIASLFSVSNGILIVAIHATGRIKYLSYISGSISVIQLPILYLLYSNGQNPAWAYILGIFGGTAMVVVNTFIAKHYISSLSVRQLFSSMIISLFIVGILTIPFVLVQHHANSSIWRTIGITLGYISSIGTITFLFVLPRNIKVRIIEKFFFLRHK